MQTQQLMFSRSRSLTRLNTHSHSQEPTATATGRLTRAASRHRRSCGFSAPVFQRAVAHNLSNLLFLFIGLPCDHECTYMEGLHYDAIGEVKKTCNTEPTDRQTDRRMGWKFRSLCEYTVRVGSIRKRQQITITALATAHS